MRADEMLLLKLRLEPALHVTWHSAVDVERLAAGIASRLDDSTEVLVLQGELLRQEEGESISLALLGGRTLVVADVQATELSGRLVSTWAAFCDYPLDTFSQADGTSGSNRFPGTNHLGGS